MSTDVSPDSKRIVILGRGGAGKSFLARSIGRKLHIPVIEIDQIFWGENCSALSREAWIAKQNELVAPDAWILDGDLGPYDVLEIRLRRATTILLLDFPITICFARAIRRSWGQMDFWLWLLTWRVKELPKIRQSIATFAPNAELIVLQTPSQVGAFEAKLQAV